MIIWLKQYILVAVVVPLFATEQELVIEVIYSHGTEFRKQTTSKNIQASSTPILFNIRNRTMIEMPSF